MPVRALGVAFVERNPLELGNTSAVVVLIIEGQGRSGTFPMFLLRQKISKQQSRRDVPPRVLGRWPSKDCTADDVKRQLRRKSSHDQNLSSADRIRKHATTHFGFSTLSLAMRGLDEAPADLWELRELEKLNLSLNFLCVLPSGLGALENLVVLNIWGNELVSLPPEIGLLQNLRVLFAYRNRLSEVPEELGCCSKLEVLSLANNLLTGLPGSLASMRKLTKLNLSHNQMAHIPACVYAMKNLVFLHLGHNVLENIAEQIQDLVNLKILILEGNSIHTLPRTLCFLSGLELLNVDFNDLQSVPSEMYLLKKLEKLACHPLDKGLHIVHNPLLKPIQEVLQGESSIPTEDMDVPKGCNGGTKQHPEEDGAGKTNLPQHHPSSDIKVRTETVNGPLGMMLQMKEDEEEETRFNPVYGVPGCLPRWGGLFYRELLQSSDPPA
ncbi:hypothetical protein NFI96_010439 [Prochilodus magdalenae]|nr:hypothetical protein NFI96_010439 [Prochilodus magdalenae]